MASDSTYHDRFLERALDPKAWEDTASQLLEAAKLLEPKLDEFWSGATHHAWSDSWRGWADEFVAIYFMLSAYAIENLMKARIVRSGRAQLAEEFQRRCRLPSVLKTHDLCKLAICSGNVGLAEGYEDILKRLTRSATWYGRYPVPLAPRGLEPFSRSSDGSPISLTEPVNENETVGIRI